MDKESDFDYMKHNEISHLKSFEERVFITDKETGEKREFVFSRKRQAQNHHHLMQQDDPFKFYKKLKSGEYDNDDIKKSNKIAKDVLNVVDRISKTYYDGIKKRSELESKEEEALFNVINKFRCTMGLNSIKNDNNIKILFGKEIRKKSNDAILKQEIEKKKKQIKQLEQFIESINETKINTNHKIIVNNDKYFINEINVTTDEIKKQLCSQMLQYMRTKEIAEETILEAEKTCFDLQNKLNYDVGFELNSSEDPKDIIKNILDIS